MHVFWNFQIQRLLGPQLMCWSHCFIELEATASNTLNIKHHQWINSVPQNIKFGSFHFLSLSTHKDCFSNAKQGGRSWAVCLHCIGGSPPTCCVIIALSSSLYHCSTVSLFALVSLQCSFIICIIQCCRRKPHKFLYTLECAGVRQDILHMCILYLYTFIFVFVFLLLYYCAIALFYFCILYLYSIIIAGHRVWWSARLVVLSIMCTSNYIPICQPQ